MSTELDTATDTDTDVQACQRCQSPVFHDELYCEACGWKASQEPERAPVPAASEAPADRQTTDLGSVAGVTDRGRRRQRNEDAFAIAAAGDRFIAVVCDGVASTANPDQAAREAATAALSVLEPLVHRTEWPAPESDDLLGRAFEEAQRAVMRVPDDEPDGNDLSPSTTMVVGVVGPGRVTVANIGDSRAYWLGASPSAARLLTVDDSWAQESIAEGIAPEVAYAHPEAHTITRWVGADADSVVPTVVTVDATEAGLLVLCSDGLWNYFEDPSRLAALVPDWVASTPVDIARRLTDAALAAGGHDNVTVVVIPVGLAGNGPGIVSTEE
jgi:serine/threonine protein phosphatase PrpC